MTAKELCLYLRNSNKLQQWIHQSHNIYGYGDLAYCKSEYVLGELRWDYYITSKKRMDLPSKEYDILITHIAKLIGVKL